MRTYFHCSTSRFGRRKTVILTLAGAVFAEAAVIAFIILFFGLFTSDRADDTAGYMIPLAAAFVVCGLLICLIAASSSDRKVLRNSRYTFADIQLKFAAVSFYAGEMRVSGRNTVFRDLYIIPFGSFVSAEPSPNGKKIIVRGKIRKYFMDSDFLGYHVRSGDIEFDRMWLNVGSFEELDEIAFPAVFGKPERLCASLREAKKLFDERPAPKKYVFREADFVRRRPKRRVLPDDLDFSRSWK